MKLILLIQKIILHIIKPLIVNLNWPMSLGESTYQSKGYFDNKFTRDNTDETWLDNAIKSALVCKKGHFIDVGANTGQTLVKLLSIDSNRSYIGFEPQIDCCFYIEEFFKSNHLTNHQLISVGLSNYTGVVTLLKRQNSADTTASTVSGFRPDNFYESKQVICVFKGDDILEKLNISSVSVIKVDVEGGELEVIEGLLGTISKQSPFIFFEVLNNYLAATNQNIDTETINFRNARHEKLEKLLRDKNYTIYNILSNSKLNKITKISPEISSDLKLTDYVAVPEDLHESFISNIINEATNKP